MALRRWLTLLLIAVAGCATRAPATPDARPEVGGARPLAPGGEPDAAAPPRDDVLWQQAAGGDALDLERLATREGATGLLSAMREGGTLETIALAALPFAEDSELALGTLCDLLASGKGGGGALRAVQDIASRLPASAERLDVEGARRCLRVLAELERSSALGAHERDLAASARALLEEQRRP